MSPLRELKKNGTELTSSLRPRKAIVVYNERKLQSAAHEERRRASTSSHNISHHATTSSSSTSASTLVDGNDNDDTTRNSRKRPSDDSKKKIRGVVKILKTEDRSSSHTPTRRSSRLGNISVTSSESVSSASASPQQAPSAEDTPTEASTPTTTTDVKEMTVAEALLGRAGAKFSGRAKSCDKFDETMESVLCNITSKSHPGYLKMSNKMASTIANNHNAIINSQKSNSNKAYVYKPRVSKFADENGLLAAILKNANNPSMNNNPSTTSLLSSYKPRTLHSTSNGTVSASSKSRANTTVTSAAAFPSSSSASGPTQTFCTNFATTSSVITTSGTTQLITAAPPQRTLSDALAANVGVVQQPTVPTQADLSQLFGSKPSSTMCLRVSQDFTPNNAVLSTSFPADLDFNDTYRPFSQAPNPAIMARTTVDIRPLGKALFHDDPSWSRYTFPKRSLFGSESLVYFYRSQRWPDRKLVLVPFGACETPGDVPYTCGPCFEFSSCLRHRFDLPQRNKIPVIIAREGKLMDDPDWPNIPHICDPDKMTDSDRAALQEYGELMARSRESKTPPKSNFETCGTISADKERRYLLDIVSRLTVCCSQLMSVGFDFTFETLREKALYIADEINLPRHCVTDDWLQNVAKWLGVVPGNAEMAALFIFGDAVSQHGAESASNRASEVPTQFINANDYLQHMISEAMSREELQQQVNETALTGEMELSNVMEISAENNNVKNNVEDSKVMQNKACDGVSVFVKESCPIELIFNGENGVVLMEKSIHLELDKKIKTEVDSISENDIACSSVTTIHTAAPASANSTIPVISNAKPARAITQSRHRSGSNVSGDLISSPASSVSMMNPSRKTSADSSDEPQLASDANEPITGIPPLANKTTLYNMLQENFRKMKNPEVENALNVIKRYIQDRDGSLLPMFNTFASRITKMMYTTEPIDCNGKSRNRSPRSFESVGGTGGEPRLSARQHRQPSAAEISAAFDEIKPFFTNKNGVVSADNGQNKSQKN